MRKLLAVLWLLVPVGLIAYHYGPGQDKLARDRAAEQIALARSAEADENYRAAYEAYAKALTDIPEADKEARLLTRLAQAKTRMYIGELPEAMEDAEQILLDAIDSGAPIKLVDQVRSTAGSMHYYVAWLMRLEGAETAEWTEQTEMARQHFRLLAEESPVRDVSSTPGHQANLEASVRLARMDLSELKGLPLPKECNGNGNCAGKCRSQKQSRTKVPKKGKGEGDARQQIAKDKSAGKNDRPEGGS
jgi:tetratricopeptide (TPR) repeat protein